MGKATGFMDYERVDNPATDPLERIKTPKTPSTVSDAYSGLM